jgi:hypothetical protein
MMEGYGMAGQSKQLQSLFLYVYNSTPEAKREAWDKFSKSVTTTPPSFQSPGRQT